MYKQIFKEIKKFDNIVIARHIRIDPDAMASTTALKESILLTFPNKKVFTIGNGTIRFNYMGKLDRGVPFKDLDNILLIVLDTPDKKRVDMPEFIYEKSIKIDHHPYVETFCDIELIDEKKSSASEIVYDLIRNTNLKMNNKIATLLYLGLVGDTNRFLHNFTDETIRAASYLIDKYHVDYEECYSNLYKRPFSELQFMAYIIENMKITDNGVGYIKITEAIAKKYSYDSVSSGDLVNNFNNTDELLCWLIATEDITNSCIRVSIRSRGPIINKVAELHGGGGHKFASGARVPSFLEVDDLINNLDKVCHKFIEEVDNDEDK